MESRQIKSLIFDLRLVRWLEGAGLLISALLYFMYFALAAGYQESLPKNASGPGVNMFEMLAIFHVFTGCFFGALLFLHLFRTSFFITLFFESLLLVFILLMVFLLSIIAMALCFLRGSVWIRHFALNKSRSS